MTQHLQEHAQTHGGVVIVIGNEHLAAHTPIRAARQAILVLRRPWLDGRQAHDELATWVGALTLGFDPPCVQFQKRLRHRQSDAQTAIALHSTGTAGSDTLTLCFAFSNMGRYESMAAASRIQRSRAANLLSITEPSTRAPHPDAT